MVNLRTLVDKITDAPAALTMVLLVALVGLAFPYGFPLFLPLTFVLFIACLATGKIGINLNAGFLLLYACIFCYGLGLLFTGGIIYENNRSDLANILSFMMLSLIFYRVTPKQYARFVDLFTRLAVPVFFFLSLLSFFKFYFNFAGTPLHFLATISWGTSLGGDYTMYSYALFAGLCAAVYQFQKSRAAKSKWFYMAAGISISISIILSGSRRGWVVIAVALLAMVVAVIVRRRFIIKFNAKQALVVVFIVLMIGSVPAYMFFLPDQGFLAPLTERLSAYPEHRQFSEWISHSVLQNFAQRTNRWRYAFFLMKEYSPLQLLFGNGFDYLHLYTLEFITEYAQEDYPHNPVISALLYSGIIGGTLVLLLIIYPLVIMWKKKEIFFPEAVSFYIFSLLFCMPSSNSVFSFKVLLFLMLISFSVHNEVRGGL